MATLCRKGDLPPGPRPVQGRLTGPAVQHPLHESVVAPVRVSLVGFEPGSRTHWHSHTGGQVLHVVEGHGLTQVEGGPIEIIKPGDIVTVGPAERHWHGAGEALPMRHLAVTIGEVAWSDEAPRL